MISAIVVHHNTPQDLARLVKLLNHEDLQIIIIDNASTNQSVIQDIRANHPHIRVIINNMNEGYARACNQGALEAKGEWLVFLNPDIEITIDGLHIWKDLSERNRYDASSPLPANPVAYAKPLPTAVNLLIEFSPLKKYIRQDAAKKTLTGGALMIKKTVFDEIGGFDERYFLWFEDSDITKRLFDAHKAVGWITVPHTHRGGASFNNMDEQEKRSIFFHSMSVYARAHFGFLAKHIVFTIQKRYCGQKHLLPQLQNGISLVVPNACHQLLLRFLEKNPQYLKHARMSLIVVSSDISAQDLWQLRKKYPSVRFIVLEKNKGFTSTVNTGFCVATTEYIGTVNDDTYTSDDWVGKCIKHVTRSTGSVNPIILKPDTHVESAGIMIHTKGKAFPVKKISQNVIEKVDATNAAAVIYTHNALQKTGLLDERFGSYLEDIDLSLRMSRNGFHHLVVGDARVVHDAHQTSDAILRRKKYWLDVKNWILIIIKNWRWDELFRYAPQILIERGRNIWGALKQSM